MNLAVCTCTVHSASGAFARAACQHSARNVPVAIGDGVDPSLPVTFFRQLINADRMVLHVNSLPLWAYDDMPRWQPK